MAWLHPTRRSAALESLKTWEQRQARSPRLHKHLLELLPAHALGLINIAQAVRQGQHDGALLQGDELQIF